MNLVLFEPHEWQQPLPRTDARARHVLEVLRRQEGDFFDAGLVDGPMGRAQVTAIHSEALHFVFRPTGQPPAQAALTLLVGLPRPQTARDVLREATTLGVARLAFVHTERSDVNYAASTLWTSGEWRRHCVAGAAQAFATQLPVVTWTQTLAEALAEVPQTAQDGTGKADGGGGACLRLALDNYEATQGLSACLRQAATERAVGLTTPGSAGKNDSAARSLDVLALGSERGWGPQDRLQLRASGFTLVHLGPRVLRVETAVVAALALWQGAGLSR